MAQPIRYREEFELQCQMCRDWWPVTLEFWRPNRGLARCLACHREVDRIYRTGVRADEARRSIRNYHARLVYYEHRNDRIRASDTWRKGHPESMKAYRRRYYLAHRDEELARSREQIRNKTA